MENLSYNVLNQILDTMIVNKDPMMKFEMFIEEVSNNEVISNSEYMQLVERAQRDFRI